MIQSETGLLVLHLEKPLEAWNFGILLLKGWALASSPFWKVSVGLQTNVSSCPTEGHVY